MEEEREASYIIEFADKFETVGFKLYNSPRRISFQVGRPSDKSPKICRQFNVSTENGRGGVGVRQYNFLFRNAPGRY